MIANTMDLASKILGVTHAHTHQTCAINLMPITLTYTSTFDLCTCPTAVLYMHCRWKGSKGDTFHTDCSEDNATIQSACGFSVTGFGPDERMNEEWFGLYNCTYSDSDDDEVAHTITLTPRAAVAQLQSLWGLATTTTTTTVQVPVHVL